MKSAKLQCYADHAGRPRLRIRYTWEEFYEDGPPGSDIAHLFPHLEHLKRKGKPMEIQKKGLPDVGRKRLFQPHPTVPGVVQAKISDLDRASGRGRMPIQKPGGPKVGRTNQYVRGRSSIRYAEKGGVPHLDSFGPLPNGHVTLYRGVRGGTLDSAISGDPKVFKLYTTDLHHAMRMAGRDGHLMHMDLPRNTVRKIKNFPGGNAGLKQYVVPHELHVGNAKAFHVDDLFKQEKDKPKGMPIQKVNSLKVGKPKQYAEGSRLQKAGAAIKGVFVSPPHKPRTDFEDMAASAGDFYRSAKQGFRSQPHQPRTYLDHAINVAGDTYRAAGSAIKSGAKAARGFIKKTTGYAEGGSLPRLSDPHLAAEAKANAMAPTLPGWNPATLMPVHPAFKAHVKMTPGEEASINKAGTFSHGGHVWNKDSGGGWSRQKPFTPEEIAQNRTFGRAWQGAKQKALGNKSYYAEGAKLHCYSDASGQPRIRVRYVAMHAPHNMEIGGKPFRGGEFIPAKFIRAATPQQRAMLTRVRPNAKNPFPGSGGKIARGPGATILPPGYKMPRPIKAPISGSNPENRSPGRMRGVGFASTETDEGLGLSEAGIRALKAKQAGYVRRAAQIDRKLGLRSSIDSGIGYWAPEGEKPGAEPTTITEYSNGRDFHDIAYSMCAKALAGNQLSALAFGSDENGPHTLWSMMVAAKLSNIGDILSKHGIEYRTLKLSNGGKTHVQILDMDGSLDAKVKAAAKELGTEPAFRMGHGEFLGGNAKTRSEARKWYKGWMRTYEQVYPERPRWP